MTVPLLDNKIPIMLGVIVLLFSATLFLSVDRSPIIETFNDKVAKKETSASVVLVNMITVPITQHYIITEKGYKLSVTPNEYQALNIGDIILVGLKENGGYVLV